MFASAQVSSPPTTTALRSTGRQRRRQRKPEDGKAAQRPGKQRSGQRRGGSEQDVGRPKNVGPCGYAVGIGDQAADCHTGDGERGEHRQQGQRLRNAGLHRSESERKHGDGNGG